MAVRMAQRLELVVAAGLGATFGGHWLYNREWGSDAAIKAARFDAAIRPTLAAVLPPATFIWLYSASRPAFLAALARCDGSTLFGGGAETDGGDLAQTSREVEVLGMRFRNDLGNSAGLDKDGALLEVRFPGREREEIERVPSTRLLIRRASLTSVSRHGGCARVQLPPRRGFRRRRDRAE